MCTTSAAAAVHPWMIQWPYFHVADADIYAEKTLLMMLEIQKKADIRLITFINISFIDLWFMQIFYHFSHRGNI